MPSLLTQIPVAYKAAVLALFCEEGARLQHALELPPPSTANVTNLAGGAVSPPKLALLSGNIRTKAVSFSFVDGFPCTATRLRLTRSGEYLGDYLDDELAVLARQPWSFTTNDAYRLATNWLGAIQLDVAALEKLAPPVITQRLLGPEQTPSPLFKIRWAMTNRAGEVEVNVEGSQKQLEWLYIYGWVTNCFTRPRLAITNLTELIEPSPAAPAFLPSP